MLAQCRELLAAERHQRESIRAEVDARLAEQFACKTRVPWTPSKTKQSQHEVGMAQSSEANAAVVMREALDINSASACGPHGMTEEIGSGVPAADPLEIVEGHAEAPALSRAAKQRLARQKAQRRKLEEQTRQQAEFDAVERMRLLRAHPRLADPTPDIDLDLGEQFVFDDKRVTVLHSPVEQPQVPASTNAPPYHGKTRQRMPLQAFWSWLPSRVAAEAEKRRAIAFLVQAAGFHDVDPFAICFSHGCISNYFRNGFPLDDIIEAVLAGELRADVFPTIEIVRYQDKLYALRGNRRLFVARVLAHLNALSEIRVELLDWHSPRVKGMRWDAHLGRVGSKWDRCHSTTNGGEWVQVRSRYARWQLPPGDTETQASWSKSIVRRSTSVYPCFQGHCKMSLRPRAASMTPSGRRGA